MYTSNSKLPYRSLPTRSKKIKLFDFMALDALLAGSNIMRDQDQPDPGRDFHRLLNLPHAAGFKVFNDTQLASLRPIALKLFSAPSCSAARERVFSQSGLVMKPTRSRLSKSRLAQLVFLKCNNHLK
jgi:hypothetical protein